MQRRVVQELRELEELEKKLKEEEEAGGMEEEEEADKRRPVFVFIFLGIVCGVEGVGCVRGQV